MFTRIWRTGFDTSRQAEIQQFAEDVSAPMFRALPGCHGYLYAVSDSTWITQTFWESRGHISDAESSALYQDVVKMILDAGFLGDNQTTEIFEITGWTLPPNTNWTSPTAIE